MEKQEKNDRINFRNLEAAAAAVQELLVRRGLPRLDDLALAELRQVLTPHFRQERREGALNRGAALKPVSAVPLPPKKKA